MCCCRVELTRRVLQVLSLMLSLRNTMLSGEEEVRLILEIFIYF